MRKTLSRLALCFSVAVSCAAITPEQVLSIRELSDVRLSPGGTRVAFVVTEPNDPAKPREPRRSSIWLVSTDGKHDAQPLPSGSGNDSSPRWSPDGKTLAFLSQREDDRTPQLYVQNAAPGSGPSRLTSVPTGVEQFQWSPDGSEIAYVVRDEAVESDPIIVDAPVPFTRLWVVNVADRTALQITRDDFEIEEMAWSPGGRELALTVTPSSRPEHDDLGSLVVVSRANGRVLRTLAPRVAFAGALRWSPDGRRLSFYDRSPSNPYETWVSVVPAAGGAVNPILKDYRGTALRVEWDADGTHLLSEMIEGTRHTLLSIDAATGAARELARITSSQWDAGFSTNGWDIAYLAQTPSSPSDVWIREAAGARRKLTDFNPQTRTWRLGAVSEVTWKNTKDGMLRRGVLITPPEYDPSRRYPTVVLAHPGDTAFWTGWLVKWWCWGQLLATNGYVVFLPNYRGVTGEGAAMHAHLGDWGSAFQDLEDGVDALVARGIADPSRLGIGGWSNGGFMTAFSITHTRRYKAAVAQAAHIDFFSLYGTSYLREGLRAVFGTTPYDDRRPYDVRSPIAAVKNCRTPTLIVHGINDAGVPIGQAYELHTALKTLNVPVQMVVYPREAHSIREYGHRVDLQRRVLAWFDERLKE